MSDRDEYGNPIKGYERYRLKHYIRQDGWFLDKNGGLRLWAGLVGMFMVMAWLCYGGFIQPRQNNFSIRQAKAEVQQLVRSSARYEGEAITFVRTNKDGLYPDTHGDIRITFNIGDARYIAECTGGYTPIVCDYYLSDIYGEGDKGR